MKTLYLLRHAKTEEISMRESDHARQLTERGRTDAAQLGLWLARNHISWDMIACSPAQRTRQTLAILTESMNITAPCDYEDALYLASAGDLLTYMQKLDKGIESLLLIGHNPGLHQLALTLAKPGNNDALRAVAYEFPTSALLKLSCPIESWGELAPRCAPIEGYWNRYHISDMLEI